MTQPPKNQYEDDPTIDDDELLWRRIHPDWVVEDQNQGCQRLSSAAFDNDRSGGPMSVLLASIVRQSARDERDVIASFPGYCLAAITAYLARQLEQQVIRDPLPAEPAHGGVAGTKTRSVRRAMAKQAEWVIPPPDHS